ncbi:P-loop containing nucleoside triphosphate hydrolase protein [Laetiporus sulphureus 93-53]|uniref:p-loop containing nucleoside triphosphate hydrolase protein n=1 Tax=Laetiporus sulphureus 93-53 TaxID=1314785 RepID=A0A165FJI5_9APHY|nr:P-loop containing nucleoside triphosphate hydrolase protein [Laetiporus sulphureus 93-53]KZT09067.1 P-loop containing nucleoside triphosphate hydrolase protein [Laetiporus sulphureus 93-53]
MNETAEELANYLIERLKLSPPDSRIVVGLAGVPASGKSTLAHRIVDHVNAHFRRKSGVVGNVQNDIAVLIGLDGWHLTRAQLDQFPDPKLAHDRRGAHWTFDGEGYVEFIRALRRPMVAVDAKGTSSSEVVYAPSFDHALKDPTPKAVPVYPYHRLVVIEGLYAFLGIDPWKRAGELLDERWWLEIDEAEAERRLVARHVRSGVAQSMEEAIWRSRENDTPNGRFLRENMLEPTRTIQSIEDPVLAAT